MTYKEAKKDAKKRAEKGLIWHVIKLGKEHETVSDHWFKEMNWQDFMKLNREFRRISAKHYKRCKSLTVKVAYCLMYPFMYLFYLKNTLKDYLYRSRRKSLFVAYPEKYRDNGNIILNGKEIPITELKKVWQRNE